MINYEPLWHTMKQKGATTYTLRTKGEYTISASTFKRLKENKSVSTNTINELCNILNCDISDVIEYIPDKRECEK